MRDVLFMADILASVTHEMQNVMAVIKESGALAGDILHLNGSPRMKYGDKLTQALQHIQEQVLRGRDLMLMLNGFAHAASDYPDNSDIVRFARQITVLADRMVRMEECILAADLDNPPLPVRGNALLIMQSLYLGLSAMLAKCRAGDCIRLSLREERQDGFPEDHARKKAVIARIAAHESEETPDAARLLPIMAELRGSCVAGRGRLELRYAPPGEERDLAHEYG